MWITERKTNKITLNSCFYILLIILTCNTSPTAYIFGMLVCSATVINLPDSGWISSPAADGLSSSDKALRPTATRTVSNSPCPF